MSNQKKVIFYIFNGTGHVNPIFPIVKELSKTCKVIVFITEDFRTKFEDINVEVKTVAGLDTLVKMAIKNPTIFSILRFNINIFDSSCKELMESLDNEKPDLILKDDFCFYASLLLKSYKKLYATSQGMSSEQKKQLLYAPINPLAPVINIFTYFAAQDKIFPTSADKKRMSEPSLNLFLEISRAGLASWASSRKHNTSLKGVLENDEHNMTMYSATICTFIKELQPSNIILF